MTFTDLKILIGTAVVMLVVGLALYKMRNQQTEAWNRKVQRAAATYGAELSVWPGQRGWLMAWTHWGVSVRFWLRLRTSSDRRDWFQFVEIIPPGGLPPFSARVRLSNSSRPPGFNPAFAERFTVSESDRAAVCSVLPESMQAELARLAGFVASGEIRSDGYILRWEPGVDLLDELPAALQLMRVLAERLASRGPGQG